MRNIPYVLKKMKAKVFVLIVSVLLFQACQNETEMGGDKEEVDFELFSLLPSNKTGINFKNYVEETVNRNINHFEYFYNGSGVALGDINNDGLTDVFFAGSDAKNQLYLNKGDLEFENISDKAGILNDSWATGVTMIDINQDGWLDIYVCLSGPRIGAEEMKNQLFINNGDLTFTEQAEVYGIADQSRSNQASFFDMDLDGDLDLWVMNHGLRRRANAAEEWLEKSNAYNQQNGFRESNTLYRNDGNGKFTDISEQAGIQKIGFGLGVAIHDFDQDGYPDVYIANDYFIPDFMYINNGDGTFTDQIETKCSHTSYFAMGCDAADFNNDGLTDLTVLDMTPSDHVRNKLLMASMDVNTFNYLTFLKRYTPQYMMNSLFVNNGFGVMSEIGMFAGVAQTDWSWAPLLADFDNDGFKDLMITNGYRKDVKNNDWLNGLLKIREERGALYNSKDYFDHLQTADVNPVPNAIFKNRNGLNFDDKTQSWGFSKPSFSNGAAYADLDNDGDLDLVISNLDQEAFVYKNNSRERSKSNYIQFRLTDGGSFSKVLHSQINLYHRGEMQSVDYKVTRGFLSSVDPLGHFGLGQVNVVDSVIVQWNDGRSSVIRNPQINTLHHIEKQQASFYSPSSEKIIPVFADISKRYIKPPFKHQENAFDDFRKEILLPHAQSRMGPAIAVADIDRDGKEDFFVGGAKGQAGMMYTQDGSGNFTPKSILAFEQSKKYEDTGAAFVDVDGDSDLDLYVASGGGGDFEGQEQLLQDRLYINDGRGNFELAQNSLPKIASSTMSIAPMDWDKDGDMDLFVGGRTTPGKYPISPNSYLLVNDNGRFLDQTKELAPELTNIGMVTGAEWFDANEDGNMDLILVGEWMPITLFRNSGKGFEKDSDVFDQSNTKGWWLSLHKADIDQDGDVDFVAGNIGLNNKFHPSVEKPLHIYANDFDDNGRLDIVLSKIYKGKKVPVRGKECSTQQMPFISEKFSTYEDFALASLDEIYEVEQLSDAVHFEANNFANVFIINQGKGNFEIKNLPKEAQLSPVTGIVAKDFDSDGITDICIAGNLKQTEVETPLYDAGKGLFLKGLGKGEFEPMAQVKYSGIFLHQDVRNIQLIHVGQNKRPGFLVANNNSNLELVLYRR